MLDENTTDPSLAAVTSFHIVARFSTAEATIGPLDLSIEVPVVGGHITGRVRVPRTEWRRLEGARELALEATSENPSTRWRARVVVSQWTLTPTQVDVRLSVNELKRERWTPTSQTQAHMVIRIAPTDFLPQQLEEPDALDDAAAFKRAPSATIDFPWEVLVLRPHYELVPRHSAAHGSLVYSSTSIVPHELPPLPDMEARLSYAAKLADGVATAMSFLSASFVPWTSIVVAAPENGRLHIVDLWGRGRPPSRAQLSLGLAPPGEEIRYIKEVLRSVRNPSGPPIERFYDALRRFALGAVATTTEDRLKHFFACLDLATLDVHGPLTKSEAKACVDAFHTFLESSSLAEHVRERARVVLTTSELRRATFREKIETQLQLLQVPYSDLRVDLALLVRVRNDLAHEGAVKTKTASYHETAALVLPVATLCARLLLRACGLPVTTDAPVWQPGSA